MAGQSNLEQPTDSGGTGETRSPSLRRDGSQVSPQGRARATLADVANFSPQPPETTHRHRLLHVADGYVPRLVRLRGAGPLAQPGSKAGVDSRTRESGRIPAGGRPPPSLNASGGLNVGSSQAEFHGRSRGDLVESPLPLPSHVASEPRIPGDLPSRSCHPVCGASRHGSAGRRDPLGNPHQIFPPGCRMKSLSPTGARRPADPQSPALRVIPSSHPPTPPSRYCKQPPPGHPSGPLRGH